MKQNIVKNIMKVVLSVVVVGGGAGTYVAYQNGRFTPTGRRSEFLANEVIFPESEKKAIDNGEDSDNEYESMKKNEDSDEQNAPKDETSADQLMQEEKAVEQETEETPPLQQDALVSVAPETLQQILNTQQKTSEQSNEKGSGSTPTLNVVQTVTNMDEVPEGKNVTVITEPSKDHTSSNAETVVNVPTKDEESTHVLPGDQKVPSTNPSIGEQGEPVSPGKQDTTDPVTPAQPSKPVTPTFPVTPKPEEYTKHPILSTKEEDSNIVFPHGGIQNDSPGTEKLSIANVYAQPLDEEDITAYPHLMKNSLDHITAKDVLYGLDVRVRLSNQEVYLISDPDNPNVKIEYEPNEDRSALNVTISVRLNEQSDEWKTGKTTLKLFDTCLDFVDSQGNVLIREYHDIGDEIDIWSNTYITSPGLITFKDIKTYQLENVFTGFSYEPNGEPIRENIVISEDGDQIIYVRDPLNTNTVPYDVYANYHIDPDAINIVSEQILSNYNDNDVLEIPFGITKVTNFHCEQMILSSSVKEVDAKYSTSEKGYVLDENNTAFVLNEDGLLLDLTETKLLGVPCGLKVVEIPETVTEIDCFFAQDQTVYLSSEAPQFNYNFYIDALKKYGNNEEHSALFVVPDTQYRNYISTWKVSEEDKTYITTEELLEKEMFYNDEGALVQRRSDQSLKLNRLPLDAAPIYIVERDVSEIGTNIFEHVNENKKQPGINVLIVPDSVKIIDASNFIFEPDKLAEIYFLTDDEIPQIVNVPEEYDRFVSIHVRSTVENAFKEYAISRFDESIARKIDTDADILLYGEDGSVYMDFSMYGMDSAFLMQASKTCTEFTPDNIPEGVTLTNIMSEAFYNHTNLKYVELPDTVTSVGPDAFKGCKNLEGLLFNTTDPLEFYDNSIEGCTKLRFIAMNSYDIQLYNGGDYDYDELAFNMMENRYHYENADAGDLKFGYLFAFAEAAGLEELVDSIANVQGINDYVAQFIGFNRYYAEKAGDGYVLYGNYTIFDEEGNGIDYNIVLGSTTSISGEITFPENTDQIFAHSFEDIKTHFSIAEESWDALVSIGSSAFNGDVNFAGIGDNTLRIVLNENMIQLDAQAFTGCESLETVEFRILSEILYDDAQNELLNNIPNGLFDGCKNLKTLEFTEESILYEMHMNCLTGTNIEKLDLPATVSSIEEYVFPESLTVLNLNSAEPFLLVPLSNTSTFCFKNSNDKTSSSNDFIITLFGEPASAYPEVVEAYIEAWKYSWNGYDDLENFVKDTSFQLMKQYVGDKLKEKTYQSVMNQLYESDCAIRTLFAIDTLDRETFEEKYVSDAEEIQKILNGSTSEDPDLPEYTDEPEEPVIPVNPDDPGSLENPEEQESNDDPENPEMQEPSEDEDFGDSDHSETVEDDEIISDDADDEEKSAEEDDSSTIMEEAAPVEEEVVDDEP